MNTTLGADDARVFVFTYKAGVLARLAHDLKLRVEDVRIELDTEVGTVQATFDPASLRVVAAMEQGREAPEQLSRKDHRDIEDNLRRHVLHPDRYPSIRFVSTSLRQVAGGWEVRGELSLHGATRPIAVTAMRQGDRLVASVQLDQRDFGIEPYKAALGALRIKPEVTVRVELAAPL